MSTQSEKPTPQDSAVVNGDASGAHIDMSETNTNGSVDVASDTNTDTPPSEGSDNTPSSGSDKNESSGENVDGCDVQKQKQSDNQDSSDVNPEVVDFVNNVVTEAATQVEEKHGDAVHDTTSQTTDTHGATENGEYRPVVVIDVIVYTYFDLVLLSVS